MIRKNIILLLLLSIPLIMEGQTNSVIEKMRKERAEMEEQIARQEKILTSTEKDIASQISNLNIITARLKERTTILEKTRSEVRSLDRESAMLNKEIEQLEKEGIIGPQIGTVPREIRITRQQWQNMKARTSDDYSDLGNNSQTIHIEKKLPACYNV